MKTKWLGDSSGSLGLSWLSFISSWNVFLIRTRRSSGWHTTIKCRCAVRPRRGGDRTEGRLYCLPFTLLTSIKSINCHSEPLLVRIRVSPNCLRMWISSSPGGCGYGESVSAPLHSSPAWNEAGSTSTLHNPRSHRASPLPSLWQLYLQVRQLHATVQLGLHWSLSFTPPPPPRPPL